MPLACLGSPQDTLTEVVVNSPKWMNLGALGAFGGSQHFVPLANVTAFKGAEETQGAGPIPGSVEGCHTDHVGGVARQVFKLHPKLRQEQNAVYCRALGLSTSTVAPLLFEEFLLYVI
ncbi:hypothetical protein EYF80_018225 [Liparis tanakae]|uniref:Uncharacterized protein n=1 Tax=Liparis tanakae TaxID=230148 RepID=A0A4Z2I0A5_9TELE|nr:hypothetical protein EYF80_018225 [Liparis tanakae]